MKKVQKVAITTVVIVFSYAFFVVTYPLVFALYISSTVPPTDSNQTIILGDTKQETNFKIAVLGDSTALGQGTDNVR